MPDIPAAAPVPAAAPPAAHEVVVDQNPVNTPAPVGSQAPPRPPGEATAHGRPESRREAIQRAFAKSREGVELPPAKARIGHNQPPEPIEQAKPKVAAKAEKPQPKTTNEAPLNLRQRPVERGEHGHFVPKERPEAPSPARQPSPGAPAANTIAGGRSVPRAVTADEPRRQGGMARGAGERARGRASHAPRVRQFLSAGQGDA